MDANNTSRSIILGYRHAFPSGSDDEGTATKISYSLCMLSRFSDAPAFESSIIIHRSAI
jgi:hypothetical protein